MQKIAKPTPPILNDSFDPFDLNFNPETYAQGKSHFQITFIFIWSQLRRQAMNDFYAFCRLADDISDCEGLSNSRRFILIQKIETWVKSDQMIGHLYWDRFKNACRLFSISNEALIGILNGVKSDIGKSEIRIKTWAELDEYCYLVACCVGEVVLSILGANGPRAKDYAYHLGRCVQYLNIMRDIEEDLALGRIYVPEEFLKAKSVSLLSLDIRSELYRRALQFRNNARPYSLKCLPAELMVGVYIEGATKYWRFGNIRKLTSSEKIWAVIQSGWNSISAITINPWLKFFRFKRFYF